MKLVTGLFLKNEENQYLVARRSVDQSMAGYWEFPDGKVEPNETIAITEGMKPYLARHRAELR